VNDAVAVGAASVRSVVAASRLGAWRSRHPEWGLYTVAASGWSVLVVLQLADLWRRAEDPVPVVPGHAGHAGHRSRHTGHLGASGDVVASAGDTSALGLGPVVGHGLVVVAMVAVMAPLVAANVRFAALRSPRRNRRLVALSVTSGWAAVWVVGAAGLGVLAWLAVGLVGRPGAVVLATLVAVGWQWTGRKRRSLSRCHRVLAPPLAPRAARRAGRRHGRELGLSCLASCAPMMAIMVVAGHGPLVAAPLTGIAWYERRRRPHHDPARQETSVALGAAGAVACLLVAVGVL
jgi:predicted metal-binding membrane protein